MRTRDYIQLQAELDEQRAKDFEQCNKVFVYGTLKRKRSNHGLMSGSTFKSYGKVRDMLMTATDGFPYAYDNKPGIIFGEVYEMNSVEQFSSLDGLEGYPTHYNRKIVTVGEVNAAREVSEAWIYFVDDNSGIDIDNIIYHEGVTSLWHGNKPRNI
jgi:gamma-glutamylcyclotransferase (GGCT)/AIG2-like uncharacterized protein YtfP